MVFLINDADDSISKDNYVKTIIKSKNGKISTYNLDNIVLFDNEKTNDISLGKISKMFDKEIEKAAEKGHKKTINNR
ncbi:hypothetical protein ACUXJ9_002431 [Staphylococcus caledonicus]|uniref:hypothetical protein n=1 Tax=Staphylococcus caledonicus TaxID=2741333 RepID=UPI003C2D78E9